MINNNKYHPKATIIMLGLIIISVNLGSVINFKGINLSWIVSFFGFVVLAWANRNNDGRINFYNSNMKKLAIFFIIWAIYGAFQIVICKDLNLAKEFYSVIIINCFIVVYMLSSIKTKYEFTYILNIFSITFFLNIVGGYYEFFTGNRIAPIDEHLILGYEGKVSSFIGNFNDFCTFLFIGIVVFLIQLHIVKTKKQRLLYFFGIISAVYLIFVNGARGGMYGCYLLAIFSILFLIELKIIVNRKMEALFISVIGLVVLITSFLYINSIGLVNLVYKFSSGGDIGSDVLRATLITDSINAFINSFGFGIGSGQSIALLGINVHNFYIEIFTEYGLLIGLGAIYLSFIMMFQNKKNIPTTLKAILRATAIALVVVNVTASSTNKMRAMWIFLTMVFLIMNTDIYDDIFKKKG